MTLSQLSSPLTFSPLSATSRVQTFYLKYLLYTIQVIKLVASLPGRTLHHSILYMAVM
jgi:hypothetical protein